jgi:hypothetical protein
MKRFLGLSDEELAENERMWREENDEMFQVGEQDASAQMRDAGITGADIGGDLESSQGDELEGDDAGVTDGQASTMGSGNIAPPDPTAQA